MERLIFKECYISFLVFLPTKQSQDTLRLKTEILKKYVVFNSIYKSRPKQVLNLPNNSGNKYFCICFWSPSEWSDMFDLGLVPLEQMRFLSSYHYHVFARTLAPSLKVPQTSVLTCPLC